MGKRSQHKMTELSEEKRIRQSIKRKEKEEKARRREQLELAKAMLGLEPLEVPSETEVSLPQLPMPAISPRMRQLLDVEKERKKKKS